MKQRKLQKDPVQEILCGFFFPPVFGITPVLHGLYWEQRREDFSRHEVLSPLPGNPRRIQPPPGTQQLRTWLVREGDRQLVQIQHDCLYANWRRSMSSDEPHLCFDSQTGSADVLSFATDELVKFQKFAASWQESVQVDVVEVMKINYLVRGVHWSDLDDLTRLFPQVEMINTLLRLPMQDTRNLHVHIGGTRVTADGSSGSLVQMAFSSEETKKDAVPMLRIEIRSLQEITKDTHIVTALRVCNEQINDVFFGLFPDHELRRFDVDYACH